MDQIDRVVFARLGSRGSQAAVGSWELEWDFPALGRVSGPVEELLGSSLCAMRWLMDVVCVFLFSLAC